MILADENIDHRLIAEVRAAGYVIDSVYESHRGLADEVVIALSRNPPRIILTEDKDFGEWVFAYGIRGDGGVADCASKYQLLSHESL